MLASRATPHPVSQNLCGSGGRAQRTKAKAIGAIHCLSTYPQARKVSPSAVVNRSHLSQTLIAVRVVEEALIPTLLQKKRLFGDGDEYKAMRADTVLALYDHQVSTHFVFTAHGCGESFREPRRFFSCSRC